MRFRFGLPIIVAGLALAGCSTGTEQSETPTEPTATTAASAEQTSEASASVSESPSQSASPSAGAESEVAAAVAALETAADAVPDGRPFDLEHEVENGQEVWEVKVASGGGQFNLHISIDGAEVLDQVEVQTPDDDIAKLERAAIEAVDALEMAASQQAGSLSEMEIDSTVDGTVIWQIDLRQADGSVIELNLDASTGEVVTQAADD